MSRQGGRTRHDNRDANETPIVDALRAAGYTVTRCKEPMLDLFVAGHGKWAALEVKSATRTTKQNNSLGKTACKPGGAWRWLAVRMGRYTHMLSTGQARWIAANLDKGDERTTRIAIVTTPAEALRALDDPLSRDVENNHKSTSQV